jgi:diguanylate cyclase (GGDEF)-like protein
MTASISTDFIAIIALCFTIYLAKRNIVVNRYKNSIYISVAVVTIILIILEIITILIEALTNNTLIVPQSIANIVGFSLCPVVPFILIHFNSNKGEEKIYKDFLALPLYLNALMCVISYKTGWIFFFNAENQYRRGNLFLLPTLISMFYFVLLMKRIIKNNIDYEKSDKKVLIPIFLIPIFGTVIQLLFKDVLLIWGSVSISLLLYYIFLRELQFNYDVQTGIRNQVAFKKEMEQYLKDDKNAVIVVLDLNDLKVTNDQYGHKAGDEIILNAAKIINESFNGIGKAFRIGGDEFCVICQELSKDLANSALTNMQHLLDTKNQKSKHKIVLAYGSACYRKAEGKDIYSVFTQADQAMYTHKAKLKNLQGRRADDWKNK